MPAPSDLVHQTTTTTGTGALTLTAVDGKRSFLTAFGTGGTDTFDYFISHQSAAEWERGTGHENAGTLVRDTVIASSNANAAVNFAAGTKDVTNDQPANRRLLFDASTAFTPTQQAQAQQNLGILGPFGGRLTLTSATPILIADATAQSTVYYAFHEHDKVPVFDGTSWRSVTFTELSLALDSDSGHTGYHQSGKLFDLFYAYVSPTLYFGTGPAWTSSTGRGTGAGTTELVRKNGILTNAVSMTLRHGSASGNTVTVPVSQGSYLGTMYATANGQTGMAFKPNAADNGTNNILGLWNAYNRVKTIAICRDTASGGGGSYTYALTTIRAAHGSSSNRISWVDGLAQSDVTATFTILLGNEAVTGVVGCTFDSTTAFGDIANVANGAYSPATATSASKGLLGFHFVSATEVCTTAATKTFFATNSGHQASGLYAELWM